MAAQIEDQSVKEGELIREPYKEKFFFGENPYTQFLKWLDFVRPSHLEMKVGKLDGEFAIRIVYIKEGPEYGEQ